MGWITVSNLIEDLHNILAADLLSTATSSAILEPRSLIFQALLTLVLKERNDRNNDRDGEGLGL